MDWLGHLLRRVRPEPGGAGEPPGGDTPGGGGAERSADKGNIEFRALFRAVASADIAERRDAARLLSGLQMPLAVRPLVVAYLAHGDPALLEALRPFGRAVTRVARSEAREPSMGGERLARLMEVAGAVGDPAAADLISSHLRHPSPAVRVAAAAALAQLGEAEGFESLWSMLEGIDAAVRVRSLRALETIDRPAAREAIRAHLDRYLAGAGAVPKPVAVFAPLLLHPEADMARLLAERLQQSQDNLNLVIGPAAGAIAERQRPIVAAATAGWHAFYTTPRHRPDEQLEILEKARDAARRRPGERALLLGPLPAPHGTQPLRHVLTWLPANPYTVRILYLGPKDLGAVVDWWRYADEVAEIPTAMEVILDLLDMTGRRITEEESILRRHVADEDRELFHRALLAHL